MTVTLNTLRASWSETVEEGGGLAGVPRYQPRMASHAGYLVLGDIATLVGFGKDSSKEFTLKARLMYSDFGLDGSDLYVMDGPVLCKYDLTSLADADDNDASLPDRAYNLITNAAFNIKRNNKDDWEGLIDDATAEQYRKYVAALRMGYWAELYEAVGRVKEYRHDGQDLYQVRDLLSEMVTGSQQQDATAVRSYITKKIGSASSGLLRFSAPLVDSKASADRLAVYVLDSEGGMTALNKALTFMKVGQHDEDKPDRLEIVFHDEGADKNVSYLSGGQVVEVDRVSDTLPVRRHLKPDEGAAEWLLRHKTEQMRTLLKWDGRDQALMIFETAQNLNRFSFLSFSDENFQTTLGLVETAGPFPRFDQNGFANNPPAKLQADFLAASLVQENGQSGFLPPVEGPVLIKEREENKDKVAAYILTLKRTREDEIIDYFHSSQWETFKAATRKDFGPVGGTKNWQLDAVKNGEYCPLPPILRTHVLHRFELPALKPTETWRAAWASSYPFIKNAGKYQVRDNVIRIHGEMDKQIHFADRRLCGDEGFRYEGLAMKIAYSPLLSGELHDLPLTQLSLSHVAKKNKEGRWLKDNLPDLQKLFTTLADCGRQYYPGYAGLQYGGSVKKSQEWLDTIMALGGQIPEYVQDTENLSKEVLDMFIMWGAFGLQLQPR